MRVEACVEKFGDDAANEVVLDRAILAPAEIPGRQFSHSLGRPKVDDAQLVELQQETDQLVVIQLKRRHDFIEGPVVASGTLSVARAAKPEAYWIRPLRKA
jgi:hypothetical protein